MEQLTADPAIDHQTAKLLTQEYLSNVKIEGWYENPSWEKLKPYLEINPGDELLIPKLEKIMEGKIYSYLGSVLQRKSEQQRFARLASPLFVSPDSESIYDRTLREKDGLC